MTIERTHHHDGTVGASATAAGEGYDASSGTAPVYVAGYLNQALRWTSGAAAAYLGDNLVAGYYDFILRLPVALPGSDLGFILCQNSSGGAVGSLVVSNAGKLVVYNGQSSVVATSATTLTPGAAAWYRLKYHCDADGQELRIFTNPSGATPDETLTGASSGVATAKMHLGNPWTGKRGTTGDLVDLDEVQVSDDWTTGSTPAAGTAALAIVAAGAGRATAGGAAAILMAAAGSAASAAVPAAGTASVALSGTAQPGSAAAGLGQIAVTITTAPTAPTAGTAALQLAAGGATSAPIAGAGTLQLVAAATLAAAAAAEATLALAAIANTGTPPSRDIGILGTTVPVSGWSTNGITSGWMTGPPKADTLTTTGPTSGWSTTSPQN